MLPSYTDGLSSAPRPTPTASLPPHPNSITKLPKRLSLPPIPVSAMHCFEVAGGARAQMLILPSLDCSWLEIHRGLCLYSIKRFTYSVQVTEAILWRQCIVIIISLEHCCFPPCSQPKVSGSATGKQVSVLHQSFPNVSILAFERLPSL